MPMMVTMMVMVVCVCMWLHESKHFTNSTSPCHPCLLRFQHAVAGGRCHQLSASSHSAPYYDHSCSWLSAGGGGRESDHLRRPVVRLLQRRRQLHTRHRCRVRHACAAELTPFKLAGSGSIPCQKGAAWAFIAQKLQKNCTLARILVLWVLK